jgi:hypothetical protein
MMTSEQLAALPAPIQEQLVRIYRMAAGMDAEEKAAARLLLGNIALSCAAASPDEQLPGAEMVAALGRIVTTIDELASAGTGA